jgi:hypothetical protein
MNEGTSDDIFGHVWETCTNLGESHDNSEVHETDDDSFHENSVYWSFHFNVIQENNIVIDLPNKTKSEIMATMNQ